MPRCNACQNTDTFVEPSISWDRNSYDGGSEPEFSKNIETTWADDRYHAYCYVCESQDIDWEYPYLDMPLQDNLDNQFDDHVERELDK